jgi:hypothetical protein
MKLLILIIGLSISSNCEGQITKTIINIGRIVSIADKMLDIDTPGTAFNAHEKALVSLPNSIPNINSIKIHEIIKNSIPKIKPISIPNSQQYIIDNPLKLNHNPPNVLTSLTALSLPSSAIFHLIATKNPLNLDYKGFTFPKTTTKFSFNNKNFND